MINIRDFSEPPHKRVDDKPYGGGPGMIMKVEPLVAALRSIEKPKENVRRIVLSAKGKEFTQKMAKKWAKEEHLVLICGRYEGIDERVLDYYADEEVRIGNYVLMGGEVAAAVVIETVARLVPGVLGNPESLKDESFSSGTEREYIQYTRPPTFEGHEVPEILLKGNHSEIAKWRKQKKKKR